MKVPQLGADAETGVVHSDYDTCERAWGSGGGRRAIEALEEKRKAWVERAKVERRGERGAVEPRGDGEEVERCGLGGGDLESLNAGYCW